MSAKQFFILAVAVATFALAAPCFGAADIHGAITSVTPASGGAPASIFVEGPATTGLPEGPKALLYVTAATKIFKQSGAERAPAACADPKVGAIVDGTYAPGPMLMIYPPRVTASEIVILSANAATPPSAAPPRGTAMPEIRDGAEVTLTGTLASGAMAIGGETTGWVMAYQTPQGVRTIEVDVSGLPARPAEGAAMVAGKIITKHYVERGPTLIVQAARVTPLPARRGRASPSATTAPPGTASPGAASDSSSGASAPPAKSESSGPTVAP